MLPLKNWIGRERLSRGFLAYQNEFYIFFMSEWAAKIMIAILYI